MTTEVRFKDNSDTLFFGKKYNKKVDELEHSRDIKLAEDYNTSGIGKRIQIIAIKNKLKIFNFFLLRMKDYNFRLGSINCKFIGSQPHSLFLKLKIYKVSKFKNACTFLYHQQRES